MPDRNITICGVTIRRTYAIWPFCALVSIISGIIASPDSPFTHSLLGHIDSAWFLDAGRWLMQGYTPYVDFADSKGPLLWLFYGIGYLLDNDGWSGMFWMYVLYYIPVYRYAWSLAVEVTGSGILAAIVVLFMPYAYLCPAHVENRCEDLLQLPLIYMLFMVVRALKGKEISRKEFFIAGIALGCMLFVKWSFPAMLLPLPFIALAYDSRRRAMYENYQTVFLRNLGIGLAGTFAVIIIVSVWMALSGAFSAMIQEYFVNTAHTISGEETDYLRLMIHALKEMAKNKFIFLVCLATPIFGCLRFGAKGLWIALAQYWILVLASLHYIMYYAYAVNSFGVFVPLSAAVLVNRYLPHVKVRLWWSVCMAIITIILLFHSVKIHNGYGKSKESERFAALTERIGRIDRPRILYFTNSDFSLGITINSQPPCRYWAYQCGATVPMYEDQLNAMVSRSADVVITDKYDFTPEKYGYYTAPGDTFPGPYPKIITMRVHWSPALKNLSP